METRSSNGSSAEVLATVIEGKNPDMGLFTQEAFGPLLCLTPIASLDEAVTIINACKYGLSSTIHTVKHINGSTVRDESTHPHGGHGDMDGVGLGDNGDCSSLCTQRL